jgi:hypothetical protein
MASPRKHFCAIPLEKTADYLSGQPDRYEIQRHAARHDLWGYINSRDVVFPMQPDGVEILPVLSDDRDGDGFDRGRAVICDRDTHLQAAFRAFRRDDMLVRGEKGLADLLI